MKHRKILLVEKSIDMVRVEIPVKTHYPIVNFEPLDIKDLAQLILDCGRCFAHQRIIKLECYSQGWDLRKWVSPLLTKGTCWEQRTEIAKGYILGKKLADARKLSFFLFKVIDGLKQVPTETAHGYRVRVIAYQKMINDTIKICERKI
jgi:hypothetical protein